MVLLCAKTPEHVDKFLNKLADKMRVLQLKEMEILLKYKKEEVKCRNQINSNATVLILIRFILFVTLKCEKLNLPFDGKINPSDLKYYQNQREEREFKVNQSKLQEYFPLEVVIDGTFKIYQVAS